MTSAQGARLRIRLRAAFGVNARADVLAVLLAASPREVTVAELARAARFTKPNVASAVDALALAGLVRVRVGANERRVWLAPSDAVLPGLRPPVPQPDWVARFDVALAVLRFLGQTGMSTTVSAIEARRLIEGLKDRIQVEAMPPPNLDATGSEFADAFDRWVVELVGWLRAPAGR